MPISENTNRKSIKTALKLQMAFRLFFIWCSIFRIPELYLTSFSIRRALKALRLVKAGVSTFASIRAISRELIKTMMASKMLKLSKMKPLRPRPSSFKTISKEKTATKK